MSKLSECYTIIWYKMQIQGSKHEYTFKKISHKNSGQHCTGRQSCSKGLRRQGGLALVLGLTQAKGARFAYTMQLIFSGDVSEMFGVRISFVNRGRSRPGGLLRLGSMPHQSGGHKFPQKSLSCSAEPQMRRHTF